MEKLKYVHVLGVPGRPVPVTFMKDDQSEGEGRVGLGVSDNPIMIDSNLEYDKFIGEFYRNLPTPSLLEDFLDGIQLRRQANENPKSRMLETFLGAAGAGKTFQAELMGRLVHEKGAMLIDCGGKHLQELLFETVIDNTKARDLFTKIDSLLQEYNADKNKEKSNLRATVIVLKKAMGEAFSQENDRIGIDWTLAAEKGILEEKKVRDAIDFVSSVNGLDRLDSSVIGLKTQKGPLIRAWEEGRPVILDEYNKSEAGTGGALQGVLQVFAGEKSSHTVSGKGVVFTFDRKEKKPGFFVTVTGNTTADGGSTHGLEQSVYSRLSPKFVADPSDIDWAHRICQCLTGLPLSTLWFSQEAEWKKACQEAEESGRPDPFAKLCRKIRLTGLTEDEKRHVPETQLILIDHYPAVLKAAEQLSKFYIEWSQAINPNARQAKDFSDEIDDEYAKMVGLNLRKMIEHISLALQPRISGSDSNGNFWDVDTDFEKPIKLARTTRFNPLEKLGTNLAKTIIKSVDNTTLIKDPIIENRKIGLRKYLDTIMENNGIIPPRKKEARQGGIILLDQLLNIHVEKPHEVYREIAELICDDLRSQYKELADQDDDSIISPATFATVFQNMKGELIPNEIILPNVKSLEEFADSPFRTFKFGHISETTNLAKTDPLTRNQLLIALTFPDAGQNLAQMSAQSSISAKRNSARPASFLGIEWGNDKEENKNIRKDNRLSVNVMTTTEGNLLLIYNKESKEALIAGSGGISLPLTKALNKRGISYINHEVASSNQLNNAFEKIAGGQNEEVLAYMAEELGVEVTDFAQLVSDSAKSLTRTLFFKEKTR